MNNFNEIFSRILKEYDRTKKLDDAIKAANLTNEQKEKVARTFEVLDAIDENAKSLRAAKEEGISRKNWLAESLVIAAEAKSLDEAKTEEMLLLLGSESEKAINDTIQKAK